MMDNKPARTKQMIPDPQKFAKLVSLRKFFNEYVDEHYGMVTELTRVPGTPDATFSMEVWSLDCTGDTYRSFMQILPLADSMTFSTADPDTVSITVKIKNLWVDATSCNP